MCSSVVCCKVVCNSVRLCRGSPVNRNQWRPWILQDYALVGLRPFNTLRPRQNGRRFADDTFKRIFLNEDVRILIKISLKFVPMSPINNNPSLVQIMAWRRSGDKPLSEPMMVSLLTHICVTRPQWFKDWYKTKIQTYDSSNIFVLQYLLHDRIMMKLSGSVLTLPNICLSLCCIHAYIRIYIYQTLM